MNYVIIYPDEMRAESLACYGHPTVKTPNIDQLAKEGTLFENNYTAHPVCVASRCSLVTGWYPHVRGYRSQLNLMPDTEFNFISELNEQGWTTALVGKDDCFDAESTKRLFTEYIPFPGAKRPVNDGKKHYTMIMPPAVGEEADDLPDAHCCNDTIDFIKRHAKDENPFMLWVNFIAPHPPYTCPEKYYDMYQDADVPALRDDTWIKNKPDLYKYCRDFREVEEEDPEVFVRTNAIYLGMISFVDDMVGQIVDTLKAQSIYEDTTIVICSDHGDFAGDAKLVEKCPNGMDDMLTKVPLIIRRPGCNAGQRIKTLTQSIDIFPTLFDFEDLEIEHDQFGVSLKKHIEDGTDLCDRVVYTEGGYDIREPQCFETLGPEGSIKRKFMGKGSVYYPKLMHQEMQPESVCRTIMRRDNQYKVVVRTNGQHELYDMENDPLEYHNLYGDSKYQSLFDELSMKTLLWLTHTSDVVPRPSKNVKFWFEDIDDAKK